MRKILILCLSILFISTGLFAQESKDVKDPQAKDDKTAGTEQAGTAQKEEKIKIPEKGLPHLGLSVSLDYMSTYLWRGTYFFQGDGAFFPYIAYDVVQTGLVISVGCELAEDYIFDGKEKAAVGGRQSADFGIDYHYSFGNTASIGAGIWYYWMFNNPDNSFGTISIWTTLDAIPFKPTFRYTHDIYTHQNDEKIGKDLYMTLSGSHDFELSKILTIDVGLSIGYYYSYLKNTNGISDITFSTNATIEKGGFSVKGGFNYIIVPMKDYWGSNKDINRFYASVGIGYSL